MKDQIIDKVGIGLVIPQLLGSILNSSQEGPAERLGPFDNESIRIMFGSQGKS